MDIGAKIKKLRQQRGLTQEELADRCELSKGFISLLERDLASPSIATLDDILECLGTDLGSFFTEKSDEKLVWSAADMYIKEDAEELKGSITWLVPTAQKNRMEPIMVELAQGGRTYDDDPHEGEEFGYVLQGAIRIVLGDRVIRVRKDESFYYMPAEKHHIENTGKNTAKFIWVSTPPSF